MRIKNGIWQQINETETQNSIVDRIASRKRTAVILAEKQQFNQAFFIRDEFSVIDHLQVFSLNDQRTACTSSACRCWFTPNHLSVRLFTLCGIQIKQFHFSIPPEEGNHKIIRPTQISICGHDGPRPLYHGRRYL